MQFVMFCARFMFADHDDQKASHLVLRQALLMIVGWIELRTNDHQYASNLWIPGPAEANACRGFFARS
jgi:hypothetical protein